MIKGEFKGEKERKECEQLNMVMVIKGLEKLEERKLVYIVYCGIGK